MIVQSLLVLVSSFTLASACTTFAVGRKATADGSVMSTHSNDGGGTTDPRLVKIPARDYDAGATRPIYTSPENYPRYVGTERQAPAYFPENCQAGEKHCKLFEPIGYIPQVNHTFAYFEATYGTMNEKQVGITESTCSGVYVAAAIGAGGKALLSIDQLSQIAMERASTAREAIQIMGDLSEEFGFYGESASFEGGSESLFVIDTTEAWAFHILADPTGTSSIWGAARVPDDSVAVVANMFSIREMDLSDPDNFMGRQDMWELAEAEGLYTPGEPKDFTVTFSDGEYAHKYYSGRRMWGVFHRLSPSANLTADYRNLKVDKPYPFAVKVDTPVSSQGVMAVMRDWYNGTRFSTGDGSGVAGGAFSTPDRYGGNSADNAVTGNWERTIAIYRSSDSYVVQARSWLPDAVGGVIWFGPAAAHGTVYVPVLAGMQSAPDTLECGWQGVYNTTTAYWANRRVLNFAQVKFSYMIEQIRAVQDTLESASVELTNSFAEKFRASKAAGSVHESAKQLQAEMDAVFTANAREATYQMNQLFNFLLFTYPDGYLNYWDDSGFHSTSLGYPVWWLEAGNYVDGPPPVELTPLHKRLLEQKQQHGQQEAKAITIKPQPGATGLHYQTASEAVPGIGAATVQDSVAPRSAVRTCVAGCDKLVDDLLYRKCAQTCVVAAQ